MTSMTIALQNTVILTLLLATLILRLRSISASDFVVSGLGCVFFEGFSGTMSATKAQVEHEG